MSGTIDEAVDFLRDPTFLPRIGQHDGRAIEDALAANLFDPGVHLKAAVIDATYAAADAPLLKRLRQERLPRLMELHTQRFTTGRFLEIDSVATLPYAPDRPITTIDFDVAQASLLVREAFGVSAEASL